MSISQSSTLTHG